MTNRYFVIWYDLQKSIVVAMQEFDTWDTALSFFRSAMRLEREDGPTVSLLGAKDRDDCIKHFGAFFTRQAGHNP